MVLILKLVCDKGIELLSGIIFDKLNFVNMELLNYSSLVIKDRRSRVTLKESLSRSGLSLKSLQSFLVLSFRMIDKLAI